MPRLPLLSLLLVVACSSKPGSRVEPADTAITGDGGGGSGSAVRLRVTLRNTSDGSHRTSSGTELPVVFAPGVFSVGTGDPPLFGEGEPATPGFEHLAEDGSPDVALSELQARDDAGVFGADELNVSYDESPLLPGATADFVFGARPDERLEFAMMWAQSNDVFVATRPGGVPLFGDAGPLVGVVPTGISLWDAGTEVNQEPGMGDSQAARQAAPGAGEVEGSVVTELVGDRDASGFSYPPLAETLELTLSLE